jgi:hypothetical protein
MKKLMFLILVIFLFSCEKNESICWECEMKQTPEIVLHFEFCNKTEEEIHHYEEINTFYHNLYGTWFYQTTTCKLK